VRPTASRVLPALTSCRSSSSKQNEKILVFFTVLLEERTDGVVGFGFGPVDHGRFYEFFIDAPAVAVFGHVYSWPARGVSGIPVRDPAQRFPWPTEGTGGVWTTWNALDAGELIKKTSRNWCTEHGMALQFH